MYVITAHQRHGQTDRQTDGRTSSDPMTATLLKHVAVIKCTKFVFGPDLAWGDHDAIQRPLVGWGGEYPVLILHPFDAFGVSFSAHSAPRFEPPATNC